MCFVCLQIIRLTFKQEKQSNVALVYSRYTNVGWSTGVCTCENTHTHTIENPGAEGFLQSARMLTYHEGIK